jgi:hypothetical protein
VKHYLAAWFRDIEELAPLQAKSTTDGFELTGAPRILISDNPHRQIPNCIGVIELRDSAEVTVNMSPLDLWRRVRHIVTLDREGKTHPSTPDVVFFLAEPGETKQQCLARLIEEDRQYYEELHSREPVWRSISLYGSDDGLPRAADHVDRGPVLIDGVDQTTGMYTEKANADIARAKEESALRDSGITRGPGRWRRGKFTEDRP